MRDEMFFTSGATWSRRRSFLLAGFLDSFPPKGDLYCVDRLCTENNTEQTARAARPERLTAPPLSHGLAVSKFGAGEKALSSSADLSRREATGTSVRNVTFRPSTFAQRIVSIVGTAPALCFIDPYGPPSIRLTNLKPLLQRDGHTDLIVKFDADAYWRHAAENWAQRRDRSDPAKSMMSRLARILGRQSLRHVPGDGLAAALVWNYMAQLTAWNYNVVAYAIRDAINQPSSSYVIYCSRGSEKIRVMNNLVRSVEDRLVEEFYGASGSRFSLLDTDLFLRQEELKAELLNCRQQLGIQSKTAMKRYIFWKRFGEFHETDFELVFPQLVRAKRIAGVGTKSSSTRLSGDNLQTF